MSRLVVVLNRTGDISRGSQAGGLATAIGYALRDTDGIWFGWSGQVVADDARNGLNLERQGNVTIATQPLTETEYRHYCDGYANRSLWPVFHYRIDLAAFDGGISPVTGK